MAAAYGRLQSKMFRRADPCETPFPMRSSGRSQLQTLSNEELTRKTHRAAQDLQLERCNARTTPSFLHLCDATSPRLECGIFDVALVGGCHRQGQIAEMATARARRDAELTAAVRPMSRARHLVT